MPSARIETGEPEDTLYYQEFENGKVFGGGPLQDQYVSNVSGTVVFVLESTGSWEMIGHT